MTGTRVIELPIPVQDRLERLHGELIEFAPTRSGSHEDAFGLIFWKREAHWGTEFIVHTMNMTSGEFFGGHYSSYETVARKLYEHRRDLWKS